MRSRVHRRHAPRFSRWLAILPALVLGILPATSRADTLIEIAATIGELGPEGSGSPKDSYARYDAFTSVSAVPVVPEPSSFAALVGLGLIGLCTVHIGRWRSQRASPYPA